MTNENDPLDSSLRDLDKSIAELRKGRAAFRAIADDLKPQSSNFTHERVSNLSNSNHALSARTTALEELPMPTIMHRSRSRDGQQRTSAYNTRHSTSPSRRYRASSERETTMRRDGAMLQQQIHDLWSHVMKTDPAVTRLPVAPPIARQRGNRVSDAAHEALQSMKLIDLQSEVDDLRETILKSNQHIKQQTPIFQPKQIREEHQPAPPSYPRYQLHTPGLDVEGLVQKIDKLAATSAEKNHTIEKLGEDMREAKENLKYSLERNARLEVELEELKQKQLLRTSNTSAQDISHMDELTSLERELLKVRSDAEMWRRKEAEAQTQLIRAKLHSDPGNKLLQVKTTHNSSKQESSNHTTEDKVVLRKAMELAIDEANDLKKQLKILATKSGSSQAGVPPDNPTSSKQYPVSSEFCIEEKFRTLKIKEKKVFNATRNLALEADTLRARIADVIRQRRVHDSLQDSMRQLNSEVQTLKTAVGDGSKLVAVATKKLRSDSQMWEKERLSLRGDVIVARKLDESDRNSANRQTQALEEGLAELSNQKLKLQKDLESEVADIQKRVSVLTTKRTTLLQDIEEKQSLVSKETLKVSELQPTIIEKRKLLQSRESRLESISEEIDRLEDSVRCEQDNCVNLHETIEATKLELREAKRQDIEIRRSTRAMLDNCDEIEDELEPFRKQFYSEQREYKALAEQITHLESSAKQGREAIQKLESKIVPVDRELAQLNTEVDELNTKKVELELVLNDMEDELEELNHISSQTLEKIQTAKEYIASIEQRKLKLQQNAKDNAVTEKQYCERLTRELERAQKDYDMVKLNATKKEIQLTELQNKVKFEVDQGNRFEQAVAKLEDHVADAKDRIREEMELQSISIDAREAEAEFVYGQLQQVLQQQSEAEETESNI